MGFPQVFLARGKACPEVGKVSSEQAWRNERTGHANARWCREVPSKPWPVRVISSPLLPIHRVCLFLFASFFVHTFSLFALQARDTTCLFCEPFDFSHLPCDCVV